MFGAGNLEKERVATPEIAVRLSVMNHCVEIVLRRQQTLRRAKLNTGAGQAFKASGDLEGAVGTDNNYTSIWAELRDRNIPVVVLPLPHQTLCPLKSEAQTIFRFTQNHII